MPNHIILRDLSFRQKGLTGLRHLCNFLRFKDVGFCVLAVKVPLDAYTMDFVFSEWEDGGTFDNKNGMDYHIPVFGGVVKEPPMHIVHIAVEMAPIAKVTLGHTENLWFDRTVF